MHFVSIDWLLWMLITIAIFWLCPARWRVTVLSVITAVFLAVVSPLSLAVLGSLCVLTYYVVSKDDFKVSSLAVTLCSIAVIGILLFFKIAVITENSTLFESLAIPLGLAYYALRLIHYLLESYKQNLPRHSFNEYFAYLFFLPTIVVGPIHRFHAFRKDLLRHHWDLDTIMNGAERVLFGYIKITFVANFLISGKFGQAIPQLAGGNESLEIYLEMVRTGLNLYFQFSGFADVAIGFARMLGFKVMENFNWPYLRKNVSEFWQSWHISLTSWCREYVFTTVFSITRSKFLGSLATMITIGLWHEVSLEYLFWGIYHGVGIAIWQQFQLIKPSLPTLGKSVRPLVDGLSILLTVHFIWIGFMLVRGDSLLDALLDIRTMLLFWA